jgi:putative drug exporter of the RND superfamily
VTFFAFATSSISFIQLFGLGAGLAILVDSTLIGASSSGVHADRRGLELVVPRLLRRLHVRVGLVEAGDRPLVGASSR